MIDVLFIDVQVMDVVSWKGRALLRTSLLSSLHPVYALFIVDPGWSLNVTSWLHYWTSSATGQQEGMEWNEGSNRGPRYMPSFPNLILQRFRGLERLRASKLRIAITIASLIKIPG